MPPDALRYFMFPQTIAAESTLRFFAQGVPGLTLLQALRSPPLPPWGSERFDTWPAITDGELLEAVGRIYKAYQDYAALHGEESSLAAISHELIKGELGESRFRIQGILRGREAAGSNAEAAGRMLAEAAVFLEMARDLDERQMELEAGIARVDDLEHEFREILGISGEEELGEMVESVTPPLVPDEMSSFRLTRRMMCWLRLFHARPFQGLPILVTGSTEVVEEALDSLTRAFKPQQRTLTVVQGELGRIPPPVPPEPSRSGEVGHANPPSQFCTAFSRALEQCVKDPRDAHGVENLKAAWLDLAGAASSERDAAIGTRREKRVFSWVVVDGATVGDLWKSLDRSGAPALAAIATPQPAPLVFLVAAPS